MIKAVTYQGNHRFNANLYALEIKSRFIDQAHADGYYTGYGSELEAKIIGNQIHIGTGAFVVQGRMNEVVSTEVVTPSMYNNFFGYVVARIETYHTDDDNNCTFKAYVNTALSEIQLRQDDVYTANAENENLVYEVPIYSFEIKNGAITNLQKLIKPIDDYAHVQKEVEQILKSTNDALALMQSAKESSDQATMSADSAVRKADSAVEVATEAKTTADGLADSISQANTTADEANQIANSAVGVATEAKTTADGLADSISQANTTANEANQMANSAVGVATQAKTTVENISKDISNYKEQIDETVADLEKNIVQGGGGSNILFSGKPQAQVNFKSDPQSQLDMKIDTSIYNNKTTLIERVKELVEIYVESLIGTENEISKEDCEEMYQEMEQMPLSELFASYLELQAMLFYPEEVGGVGFFDSLKTEDLCGTAYSKIVGSYSKESGDFNMLRMALLADESLLNISLVDGQGMAKNGNIRFIGSTDLAESANWTSGSANIKFSDYGVYMVEFYKYDTNNPRFHVCSLCSYYGSGMQAIRKTESFTPQIVRIEDARNDLRTYRFAKAYPYRDNSDDLLKIHIEYLDNNETISIMPHIVRYYQII